MSHTQVPEDIAIEADDAATLGLESTWEVLLQRYPEHTDYLSARRRASKLRSRGEIEDARELERQA